MSKFDVGDRVVVVHEDGDSRSYAEVLEVVFVTKVDGKKAYGVLSVERDAGAVDEWHRSYGDQAYGAHSARVFPEARLDFYRLPINLVVTPEQYRRIRKAGVFKNKPPVLKEETPYWTVDARGLDA